MRRRATVGRSVGRVCCPVGRRPAAPLRGEVLLVLVQRGKEQRRESKPTRCLGLRGRRRRRCNGRAEVAGGGEHGAGGRPREVQQQQLWVGELLGQPAGLCSTTRKGISLWQSMAADAQGKAVPLSLTSDRKAARPARPGAQTWDTS